MNYLCFKTKDMTNNQINIKFKNIRAIKDANIILDGITVIAGENGSGKSTISKLTYNIIKTSLDFDRIIQEKLAEELKSIYRNLDFLSRDLSYFLGEEEYLKIRQSFRKLYKGEMQLSFYDNELNITSAIDYLIDLFNNISEIEKESRLNTRLERIKKILENSFHVTTIDENASITELLEELKNIISNSVNESNKLKELRPISILYETLNEAFYDKPLNGTFNLFEYGVPIIDKTNEKLSPIHSIQNIVYIDTPMVLGIDFLAERAHWEHLNELLTKKTSGRPFTEIDSILKNEIIKGDFKLNENEISDKTFLYKRDDGKEFDLLECATGLKSFAILQILYKNGFLTKGSLLIIDEPEVHLHPQWVVEYARLIVLLNKKIGVKFLIASHHPDMISAIKYIAEKEKNASDLQFYLAKEENQTHQYVYDSLGTDIEEIFTSFNIALERIDLYGATE